MRQRQSQHYEHVLFSQQIKQFLSTYKTVSCQDFSAHHAPYCHQYHSSQQKRRNPYKDHGFLYQPSVNCDCKQEDCNKCHNDYEYFFHPLVYKTSKCLVYNCQTSFFCVNYHDKELQFLMRYQFFRFDLEYFKTEICPNRQQPSNMHQLASCRFYHNQSDKRRNPGKVAYSHVQCESKSCNITTCQFAHNKIQQLYHPARYKTKYCQSFINKKTCQYSEYCSFAHSDEQIKIQLLHLLVQSPHFFCYKYKTVWCPYTNQHDRSNCCYAHNFQDFRRDPKKKNYSPEICPYWAKGQIKSIEASGCQLRMDCPKSHGWLQNKYHPTIKMKEFGKIENQQIQPLKSDQSKLVQKKKAGSNSSYGVGAPFFQKDQKPQKSESQRGNSGTKSKQNVKTKVQASKGFKFSFFLPFPGNQSQFLQNSGNRFDKSQIELCWTQQTLPSNFDNVQHAFKDGKNAKKTKILKKTKVQYTKSLKQLIPADSLYEKLISNQINQTKLLSLSQQDLQKLEMTNQDKQLLMNAIKEYSKSHKLDRVKYSESLMRFFRARKSGLTMQKLRKKGITQSYLQRCSDSTIEEFSFLEEQEKFTLPKIIDQYKDDHAFRQLNKLIEQEAFSHTASQQKSTVFANFKT